MDPQSNEERNLQELAAELEGHEITDESGNITEGEEPSAQTPAAEERTTPENDTPTAEKPAEPEAPAPKQEADGTESELGVDESGKRYIPEKRFKEVYGKLKEAERELALKSQAIPAQPEQPKKAKDQPSIDRTDVLEVEILKGKLPQFDPESDQYSRTLDEMGNDIFTANPGITRLEAARRAIRRAKEISQENAVASTEARQVKTLQADQGLTSNGAVRSNGTPNPANMTEQEMERYLKEHGAW